MQLPENGRVSQSQQKSVSHDRHKWPIFKIQVTGDCDWWFKWVTSQWLLTENDWLWLKWPVMTVDFIMCLLKISWNHQEFHYFFEVKAKIWSIRFKIMLRIWKLKLQYKKIIELTVSHRSVSQNDWPKWLISSDLVTSHLTEWPSFKNSNDRDWWPMTAKMTYDWLGHSLRRITVRVYFQGT